ncbi:hypothetical protein APHAL10511_001467, partial [Amanita phalloides]
LCDDSFEEHVLPYPPDKRRSFYFTGINTCTKEFHTLPRRRSTCLPTSGFIKTKYHSRLFHKSAHSPTKYAKPTHGKANPSKASLSALQPPPGSSSKTGLLYSPLVPPFFSSS